MKRFKNTRGKGKENYNWFEYNSIHLLKYYRDYYQDCAFSRMSNEEEPDLYSTLATITWKLIEYTYMYILGQSIWVYNIDISIYNKVLITIIKVIKLWHRSITDYKI